MPKNIVICADGTGNRGGTTPDTNVYRIYQAVDLCCGDNKAQSKQISFYDNGVGTSTNKYYKALTGAVGIGFRQNVKEMYSFLAQHYESGDKVFLFGFSRGAAEVRALNGMIAASGLIKGAGLDDVTLAKHVDQAFTDYRKSPDPKLNKELTSATNFGAIRIAFIGVWDTVSALGFPKKWPESSLFLPLYRLVSIGFTELGRLFDKIPRYAHRFYNYELTSNIEKAYHALAIDDQRLSFEPTMWNEETTAAETITNRPKGEIEQVWFPGMHSNVGGGYGRTELSYISLEWMLEKAVQAGLHVGPDFEKEVEAKANSLGLMHDSRDGLAIFYRYTPRNITDLSRNCKGPIKIHSSALIRMENKAQNYAPDALPRSFSVIKSNCKNKTLSRSDLPETPTLQPADYQALHTEMKAIQGRRIFLYTVFLESIIALLLTCFITWIPNLTKSYSAGEAIVNGQQPPPSMGKIQSLIQWVDEKLTMASSFIFTPLVKLMAAFGELITYLLPSIFDNFVRLLLIEQPILGIVLIVYIYGLKKLKDVFRDQDARMRDKIRCAWFKTIKAS